MNRLLLAVILLLLYISTCAQDDVRITRLSSKYDLVATQSNCKNDWRGGKCDATVQLFRKKARMPFQSISLRAGDEPPIFGDFNFDGQEDLAICDGTNGGYVTPSYRVYLYSPLTSRFAYSPSFTELSQGPAMGFFDIDKRNKTLATSTKIGSGYFIARKYDIYRGKPRLIYERIHDESSAQADWAVITTRRLIGGKWRTWRKRGKTLEQISAQ